MPLIILRFTTIPFIKILEEANRSYLGADIPADGNLEVAVQHRKTLPGEVLQNIEQHSNQPNSLEAQESDCTKHSLGKQP